MYSFNREAMLIPLIKHTVVRDEHRGTIRLHQMKGPVVP